MIFIPENVPSSKNSRQWTGKRFVVSKAVLRWRKSTKDYWTNPQIKDSFDNMLKNKKNPYKIGMHFVRKSRHKYDWVNPVQTIQDEMVKHGWIEDDNVENMFPYPLEVKGTYTTYSKENPGVYIEIL